MSLSPSKASVVICAYTERRYAELLACVGSIWQQTMPPLEIIVVIDHNPALRARVENERMAITLLENRGMRGLAGARNTGIAAARGEWIAFLDEDAVAEPTWLERLGAGYRDENVMGVGGAIVPRWESGRPDWFPEEFDWVVGCTYRGMPEQAAPVRNLIGCNMSFRREALQIAGAFRDGIGRIGTLPLGCEETELCIRLRQRRPDTMLRYEPAARVHHVVPNARSQWNYFSSRCYAEGISKAQITRFVGAGDSLSSERVYASRVLPRGVLRNSWMAVRSGKLAPFTRAAAILGGLGLTGAGYVRGMLVRSSHAPLVTTRTDAVSSIDLG